MGIKLNGLEFVQIKGMGLEGFGIVSCEANTEESAYCLMTGDMDEDFGTVEIPVSDIELIDEVAIRTNLNEISNNKGMYPYFIIQLNDIEELKEYHIEEDDFIKNIRNTNPICLDLED